MLSSILCFSLLPLLVINHCSAENNGGGLIVAFLLFDGVNLRGMLLQVFSLQA